ncbi:hypothetical protein [Aquimarina algicola]|uniref:Glycine dehydrogenase n=1 Tax=Aquimarina algicola TaxID=2589995 RepID=A0A504ISN8_9FLAO|nr:hypothetical protein [Aquimarina algicola]TPN81356.1 hypothetical protein FHK87_25555 [Aquimarina algicola]
MKTNSKLFISCEEAKYICDKNQYGEASFPEILQLNIRLIYCKITRAYVKRNKKLTETIRNSDVQTISASQKKMMKEELQKQLGK